MNENIRDEHQAIVDAAIAASGQLVATKVPHCLVGRLGLLSRGHSDGMKQPIEEITFLVDQEAAFMTTSSKVVVVKVALPLAVGDFRVKWCSLEEDWESAAWAKELAMPKNDGDIPVASLTVILCMMMMSGDDESVVGAITDGADASEARSILTKWKPHLGARLTTLMRQHE